LIYNKTSGEKLMWNLFSKSRAYIGYTMRYCLTIALINYWRLSI